MNWIDWIIIVTLIVSLFSGWQKGFARLIASFISIIASFWLASYFHSSIGAFIIEKFSIPKIWSDVVGYITVVVASEYFISTFLSLGINSIPKKIMQSLINRGFGSFLSVVNNGVISAFILLLIMLLPLQGNIKQDIKNSLIGSKLLMLASKYSKPLTSSINQATRDSVKFLTIDSNSQERLNFNFPNLSNTLADDQESQQAMIVLVNNERVKNGLSPLVADAALTTIAREKSRDMFARRYFSHYDPEGKNAAEKAKDAGITYSVIGENLAYAPDTSVAHEGLMNSPDHRANILNTSFHRIGIGVSDGGIFGKMFSQIFVD